MVQINFAQKQVNAKIVYYGPGMSGKTTNLEIVHQRAPAPNKGELTSISTDGDRTLFFDFMPLDLGTVAGMRTSFQLYTVPGQVYYNSTRKLVLQGVDGVVFVADSSAAMVEENLEALRNLEQNLAEYGKNIAQLPLVLQYNKRDLPDALPVEELNRLLNPWGVPTFEATANTGQGVFPTLKALAARVLETIHAGNAGSPTPAPAAHPAPAAQQMAGMASQQHQHGVPSSMASGRAAGPQPMPMQAQPVPMQAQHMPMQAQPVPMQAVPMQAVPMQPMPMQAAQAQPPAPTGGYGFAQTVGSAGLQMAPAAQAQQQPQPGMMRVERNQPVPPPQPGKPRSLTSSRPPAPQPEATRPAKGASTPAKGSGGKRAMYAGLFLVVALGVGLAVAKLVFRAL
jgi:hypothetical protein